MISIAETALTARTQVEVSNGETWSVGVMEKGNTPVLPSMESLHYQRAHTVSVDNGYSVYFGHH